MRHRCQEGEVAEVIVEMPSETTQTTVVQQSIDTQPVPWMTRHLTAVITLLLTVVVCWLALRGDRDAVVALMGSYGTLIGVLFGSRTALKVPGRDT
jgi:hypothetical protein